MQYTRRELVDDILDYVREPGDAGARTTAERLVNRALEAVWLKRPWNAFLSPSPFQLTLVASTRSYAMPDTFGRVGLGAVKNLSQSGQEIGPITQDRLDEFYPSAGTSLETAAIPQHYCIAGVVGVQTQVSSAGEALEVLSDSASDTAVLVTLSGDYGGQWQTRQVTLNGTSAVAAGTWTYVDAFSKAYPAGTDPATALTSSVGTVTLRKVTGAVTIQQLLPQESQRQHQVITFYPKPVSADVVSIPYLRSPKRLWHDADPLPDNWMNALFEECIIQWRINTGELSTDAASNAARPALVDLVAFENEKQPRRWVRPFQG